jgi:ferredoxin
MTVDAPAVAKGCPKAQLTTARHLCRTQLDQFRKTAASGNVTIGCTQEAHTFRDIAASENLAANLSFVNVREFAGWSDEGAASGPKMAALLAAAAIQANLPSAVTFESKGVTLILGRDQAAIDAAKILADELNITVLLKPNADVVPPFKAEFPVHFGHVRSAKGHLGAFKLLIDDFSTPAASSRARLIAGAARNGAASAADIIIDLTGDAALFSAHDLRQGYLRADPSDEAAVQKLVFKASTLVGTFDKPRYVKFDDDLCAHSRSRITGCTRCLDVCPAGAITPAGKVVSIDPFICGGCGQCSAVCPTGAAGYEMPAIDVLLQRVRAGISAYRKAGGEIAPLLVFFDSDHGEELIFAASHFGVGLPAHAIPFMLNETTQIGLELCAASLAYGAAGVRAITRAKPKHDISSLRNTLATANKIAEALGYGADLCQTIETDDPEMLSASLRIPTRAIISARPAAFLPMGNKRELLKLSFREMHRSAPAPVEAIPMPNGSPFGGVIVQTEGCTLCLACVSTCPPHALTASEDKPQLKFDESLCVQCGLCQATCPEKVISLEPRIDFAAFEAGARVIKEEQPFCCTRCAKPFGVKSTVDKVIKKLEGQHWMFAGANASRLELIKMCDTCRVEVMTNEKFDPYAGAQRPAPKTSDDYIKERESAMLAKIAKEEV